MRALNDRLNSLQTINGVKSVFETGFRLKRLTDEHRTFIITPPVIAQPRVQDPGAPPMRPTVSERLAERCPNMARALADFSKGRIVLVMDSEDRECECDVIWPAATCTAEQMAFAIKHSTGIVCVATDKVGVGERGREDVLVERNFDLISDF